MLTCDDAVCVRLWARSDFSEMERRVAESSAQLQAVKDELASAITERNSLRQSLSDR